MSVLLLPILRSAQVRAWPLHDDGGRAEYVPLGEALRRRFTFDAHTAAYSMPSTRRRLNGLAPERLGGVRMALAIFDVDGKDHRATDEWRRAELAKLAKLRRAMPGLLAYMTRGGYRIIGAFLAAVVICTREDVATWRRRYVASVRFLEREFGILADGVKERGPSVSTWCCLFRLPHATREPRGRPEERLIIGDVDRVGVWTFEPGPEELAPPPAPQTTRAPECGAANGSVAGSRTYGEAALEREVGIVIAASRGTINDRLNVAALKLGRLVGAGALDRAVVARQLFDAAVSAAVRAGFPADCQDGRAASKATIESGLIAGEAQPRTIPPRRASGPPPHTDDEAPSWIARAQ